MQVTETQVDALTHQFRVALPAADIARQVEEKLEELAQSAKLPGFRPGKVPLSLLRKRYGPSVRNEVVEQAISESSQKLIADRSLRPALAPSFDVPPLSAEGDVEYTMSVEVLPEITPPDYAQIKLERWVAQPTEEEIQRRLQQIAETLGQELPLSEPRPAAKGDIVTLDIVAPEDRWPFEPDKCQGLKLRVGEPWPIAGFTDQLIGHGVGEQVGVTVTFGDDVARPDLVGQSKTYEVSITEVAELRPALLDDEFAQRVGAESIDELMQRVRERHSEELKSHTRMRLKRALLDQLDGLYSFDVPTGLLKREYASLVQQFAGSAEPEEAAVEHDHEHHHHDHDAATCTDPSHDHSHGHDHHSHSEGEADALPPAAARAEASLTPEQLAECKALAERRVRLGLVLAEIGRANDLKVTPEELGKAMIAEARRYTGQEQAVFDFLRKNQQAQEAIAAPVLEEKVIDFIVELAQVSEREVSTEELLRDPDGEATSSTVDANEAQ